MSRNWFTAILLNLHVNDKATYIHRNEPWHDPMHKSRLFLDHLLTHFPSSFFPYENLTTDEGVCGYQGRVIFSVYMKNKPDKYDIKMFTLCHSKKGYVLCTEVYTGKGQQENSITGLLQQFSWTDFTAHQLFLIPCGQERPKLQVHACQIKNNCQDNMLCQKN